MKDFELYEPKSIGEACRHLAEYRGRARVLAGGTDLLVALKSGRLKPAAVVSLKQIKGLNKITYTRKEGLRMGPWSPGRNSWTPSLSQGTILS